MALHPELRQLEDQLDAIERDAQELVAGLIEERGGWRAGPGSWSVAECLDHLAIVNRVYLAVMQPAALRAFEQGRQRRGPALPGIVGSLFAGKLRPRAAPPVAEALASFIASQDEVRAFVRANSDLDLAACHRRS